jgi:hypothetical protein
MLVNQPPSQAKALAAGERVMVLLGGWPDEEVEPYTAVSSRPCSLRLPPLPRDNMWDPVAATVTDQMLLCNIDYDQYMTDPKEKDFRCWGLDLAAPKAWTALPPPPVPLFLSASAAWLGQLVMVGGSREHHHDLEQLEGTTHLQLYHPGKAAWTEGPPLPAPLFEGCVVAVGTDGLLVLGDFEAGATNLYLLEGGLWRALPVSGHPHVRPGCSVAALDGGEEGLVAISGNRAEFFSLRTETWRDLPQPTVNYAPTLRVSVGLSLGRLVVAGGLDMAEGEMNNKMEAFEGGQWVAQPRRLSAGRTHQAELHLPAALCAETPPAIQGYRTANRTFG